MNAVIYYLCRLPLLAGGELVNVQHVASLRAKGWRAMVLLSDDSRVEVPTKPYPAPLVQRGASMRLRESDVVVLPEVTPEIVWKTLKQSGCSLVMHNQNPFYTYRSFPTIHKLNEFGLVGGLCCSGFTRDRLHRWGSLTEWQVVSPFVLPHFAEASIRQGGHRKRQIVYMPRKRPSDAAWIRSQFELRFPKFQDVAWVEIRDRPRVQVASMMAESLVFVSLSHMEGLGLPPLEAMAAGCLVVGFTGGGGEEFSTPRNGRWVDDGDLDGVVEAIAADLSLEEREISARQEAGRETVARFSRTNFETMLHKAWLQILGTSADYYRFDNSVMAAGHVD